MIVPEWEAMLLRRYPREYLDFAECILKEYPERQRELCLLENELKAVTRSSPVIGGVKSRRSESTEPERLHEAKDRHPHYRRMERCLDAIRAALDTMTESERRAVDLLCWQGLHFEEAAVGMNLSPREMYRLKRAALGTAIPFFITWATLSAS